MKRLLIIGATVVALSATAVVAWAGTGPVADIGSHVASQTRGQDIDPIVMRVLDQIQSTWRWQGHDAANAVADHAQQVADPMRDATMERGIDVIRDAVDQVRDRAHDLADLAREAVHDQSMAQDHVADQGHVQDGDTAHDRNLDRDGSMGRSMGRDHMGDRGRMDR